MKLVNAWVIGVGYHRTGAAQQGILPSHNQISNFKFDRSMETGTTIQEIMTKHMMVPRTMRAAGGQQQGVQPTQGPQNQMVWLRCCAPALPSSQGV